MHLLFQLSTLSWLGTGLSVLCSGSALPHALCLCLILPVLVVNWEYLCMPGSEHPGWTQGGLPGAASEGL